MSVPLFIARIQASFAALQGTFAASLSPRTASDPQLVEEQLAISRQGSWTTIFVLPVGAVVIALAESAWVPTWRLVLWPLLVLLTTVGFEIGYRAVAARPVTVRARATVAMTFVQSLVWCAMAPMLWPGDASVGQTLLFLTIACTLAGWASMGAVHFANGAAAMPIYLVTLVCMPLFGEGAMGGYLAILSAAFWFMMVALFNANYETREKLLRMVDERGKLVDELKRAKDDSDRARERAESASRAKSEFLANMSHELRTPLNAILGFSEIIHTRAMGGIEKYSEYGGYIHGSGELLLALINDILDLAKIEAGRLTLHESEMELAPAMENTTVLMSQQAAAGRVTLAIRIEDGFPVLHADERAIRQILTNLTSNAVKFTRPGGHIVLFAHLGAGGEPVFGVEDDGIGIAPDDHARVFESFGQGRHDVVIAHRGTGLGLPIVRGLVEAMDGRISLESAPSKGTRVTVALPASRVRARLRAVG